MDLTWGRDIPPLEVYCQELTRLVKDPAARCGVLYSLTCCDGKMDVHAPKGQFVSLGGAVKKLCTPGALSSDRRSGKIIS